MGKTNDEALARIEHKVDMILAVLKKLGHPVYEMKDDSHTCPVCRASVKYIIDMQDKSVSRQCGCKTGKFAPMDLEQFAPPPAAGGTYGQASRGDGTSEGESSGREPRRPKGPQRR